MNKKMINNSSIRLKKHVNKPILAILTESIRRDNHVPLKYFNKIRVYHFYKQAPYGEMTKEELEGAIQYKNLNDLKEKIFKLKPDIIQGAEPYGSKKMFLLSYLAYRLSSELKIPLIFPCWENRPIREKFSWLKRQIVFWFLKKYVKQASLIFYLNKGAKANLLEAGADSKKMIKFLWGTWGVDTGLFKPKLKTKTLLTGRQVSNTKTILFGGRLDKAKGIEYLMPAFLEVKKKIKNVRLILIGLGELEKWVHNFVEKHNLSDSVEFTGIMKTKDLPFYFSKADVFTCLSIKLPWWEEQVGMINLQAMSSGVPIVSTYSGAIPEYVPDGEVGILVPEKNSRKTAQAIIKILDDKKMAKKFSRKGRIYALENYSAVVNIKKAEKIIIKLLK